ncbi:hypothetical protein [Falsiroseomonas sp. E2-1-a20]|uniref:hypothetical protein n=1 Tax=Falsiroseomonas sp. E2-1-a20 TaxID=3239300 RepID=UPI003F3C58D5
MPDKPGAQFQDHPNMVAGRATRPRALADFAAYQFATQCPTPALPLPALPGGADRHGRPSLTGGEALDRLRCQAGGQPPEIAGLSLLSVNVGKTWPALRIEAEAWRPGR